MCLERMANFVQLIRDYAPSCVTMLFFLRKVFTPLVGSYFFISVCNTLKIYSTGHYLPLKIIPYVLQIEDEP